MKIRNALLGILLVLPVGMKAGLPAFETELSRVKLLIGVEQAANPPVYGVESINQGVLTLYQPDGTTVKNTLAGLAASPPRWQNEATGILGTILQSSQGRVFVKAITPSSSIVALPNDTTLQRILLSNGVAKTDPQQLALMPADVAASLRQAETQAKQQRKNIWAEAR